MSNEFYILMFTQLFFAVATIATLKSDNKWIKRTLTDHENRIRKGEQGKRGAVEMSELSEFGV